MPTPRRMIVLTDGYRDPHTAKTAICVIRYRPEEVVAVLDRQGAGQTGRAVAGRGRDHPRGRRGGRRPGGQRLAGRHCPARRQAPAALAADPPGGRRPRPDRDLRHARVSRATTPNWPGPPPGTARELVDLRRNDERDVANRQRHPRRLPPHPHRRQRLQLRQDGRGGRSRPRTRAAPASMPPSWPRARPASSWPAAAAPSTA